MYATHLATYSISLGRRDRNTQQTTEHRASYSWEDQMGENYRHSQDYISKVKNIFQRFQR